MQLTVDTTWWTRYRSQPQEPRSRAHRSRRRCPGLLKGEFPAIPRIERRPEARQATSRRSPTPPASTSRTIEQGGTSLYPSLAQRVNDPEVLRVVLSIGPTETMHFQTWQRQGGQRAAVDRPDQRAGVPRPQRPAVRRAEDFQTNLIMPEPTTFLNGSCRSARSSARPRPRERRWARPSSSPPMGLFIGQSPAFFAALTALARQADAARR